jgi:hypothetical protein
VNHPEATLEVQNHYNLSPSISNIVPPPRSEMNDEGKKQEIATCEDIDGKASSNRLVTGGAIAGGGATMIGGEFSAKVLLNGKDNGKQEYFSPDMMESLASCIECSP